MENKDIQALLNVRNNLINDYNMLLDGSDSPAVALVKQSDVAKSMTRAIKHLEEILSEAGGVKFK
jgi:hypothetical protein